jgi:hypothetical protein
MPITPAFGEKRAAVFLPVLLWKAMLLLNRQTHCAMQSGSRIAGALCNLRKRRGESGFDQPFKKIRTAPASFIALVSNANSSKRSSRPFASEIDGSAFNYPAGTRRLRN